MEELLSQSDKKLHQRLKQNTKILAMLKAKLFPLHRKKINCSITNQPMNLPSIKEKLTHRAIRSLHDSQHKDELQIVNQSQICTTFDQENQKPHELLERAKELIKEKNKKLRSSHKDRNSFSELTRYVKMFESGQENYSQKYLMHHQEVKEIVTKKIIPLRRSFRFSREKASVFNARLRCRLNHRKIIELNRNF